MRSARGIKVSAFLDEFGPFLLDHGGHDAAGGFTLEGGKWPAFLQALKSRAAGINLASEPVDRFFDADLPPKYLTPDLLKVTGVFKPATDDDAPVFRASGLTISALRVIGKPVPTHVRMEIAAGSIRWPAIYWRAADKIGVDFDTGDTVTAVFNVTTDWFAGHATPQLIILDMFK
jgi:single-stranded-DNA-specific exonuclease